MTQAECARYLGISPRSYQIYEADEAKCPRIKYESIIRMLEEYGKTDEEHGILTLEKIKTVCAEVFSEYNVGYCYLFGSYAKGIATEKSDVDLLISTDATGLEFFGLIELLREKLKKKVDLLNSQQLNKQYGIA